MGRRRGGGLRRRLPSPRVARELTPSALTRRTKGRRVQFRRCSAHRCGQTTTPPPGIFDGERSRERRDISSEEASHASRRGSPRGGVTLAWRARSQPALDMLASLGSRSRWQAAHERTPREMREGRSPATRPASAPPGSSDAPRSPSFEALDGSRGRRGTTRHVDQVRVPPPLFKGEYRQGEDCGRMKA